MSTAVALTSSAVVVLALVLRLLVGRLLRRALSVDSWFWKAYVEASRRDGRFPPALPQYLLDEAQWYPPLFPYLLVRLPPRGGRWERHLGLLLDLVRLLMLLAAAAWLGGSDVRVVEGAGLLYATAPVLVSYNVQLNPRAMGAVPLDAAGLLLVSTLSGGGPTWTWPAVLLLSALVLLTHKMTAQLFWFLCLAGAVLALDWRLLATIPLSVAAAWLLSGGFFAKVLRAHADIVAFWNRNWRWLHADPIRESPVYGEAGYVTPGRLHQPGITGVRRHVVGLLRLLPGGWIALALIAGGVLALPGGPSVAALEWWAILIVAWTLLTTFVPSLKCLGAGSLYLYNLAFPVALLFGLALRDGAGGPAPVPPLALAVAANLGALTIYTVRICRWSRDDPGWDALVRHLGTVPRGPIFCLPQNLYDEIAYRTGQPVLFGGHGHGLQRLEPFFPRLRLSFAEMRERYGLRYVVAREGSLNEKALADLPASPAVFGGYRLFEWEPASTVAGRPNASVGAAVR